MVDRHVERDLHGSNIACNLGEQAPLQRRHSDDAGESDLAEHSPAEPESFDLAAVNGELAALGSR